MLIEQGRLIRRHIIQLFLRLDLGEARAAMAAYEAGLSPGERDALAVFDAWQDRARLPVEPIEVEPVVRERAGPARVYAFEMIRRKKAA